MAARRPSDLTLYLRLLREVRPHWPLIGALFFLGLLSIPITSTSSSAAGCIALAHAFLKHAPILILDEPTSSADLATDVAILGAKERLMHGRTTLMIAHRPSTLSRFDLLVMENGRSSTLSTPASSGGEWVA
jgi:ABC-type cobalamin/Fe3+-siderophores transport system ATPase subunit